MINIKQVGANLTLKNSSQQFLDRRWRTATWNLSRSKNSKKWWSKGENSRNGSNTKITDREFWAHLSKFTIIDSMSSLKSTVFNSLKLCTRLSSGRQAMLLCLWTGAKQSYSVLIWFQIVNQPNLNTNLYAQTIPACNTISLTSPRWSTVSLIAPNSNTILKKWNV